MSALSTLAETGWARGGAASALRFRSALGCVLMLGVIGLIWYSIHLAATRMYQVDECCNVYVARAISTGQPTGGVTLLQLLLAWVSRGFNRSADLFASARWMMVEIFWVNILLMAFATGVKLWSMRGLFALVGAATLAPLWDYGIEARHDNLLLAGLLLTWCLVRVRPSGPQAYLLAGGIAVALQFVAFKSFVYTVPISVVILAFPHPGHKAPRWRLLLAWAAGAIVAYCLIRLLYSYVDVWQGYVAGANALANVSASTKRFSPGIALGRLLHQTPLLLALLVVATSSVVVEFARRGKAALNWDGYFPEAVLASVALAGFLANPTPFPYNLVNFVPFAFVFVFRYASEVSREIQKHPHLIQISVAVLIFAHLVPFGLATRRHMDWPGTRQGILMEQAESLTDPEKDPVFDGIGMVPTRRLIDDHRSFIHTFTIQNFVKGPGPKLRDMLAARPAAVIIPSYRTDWLPEKDHEFIREHYVALADDFLVLGKILPIKGGEFEIIHPGRYRISTLEASDLSKTYRDDFKGILVPEEEGTLDGTLDGTPLGNKPVELTVGRHRLECAADVQPAVVWVGPQIDRIHRLGPGDHRSLFVNWY